MPDTIGKSKVTASDAVERLRESRPEYERRIREARERFDAAEERKQAIRERIKKENSLRGRLQSFLAVFNR